MRKKFSLIFLMCVMSVVMTFGGEPYKIGKFDSFATVYKQIKPDGKAVVYIPAGFKGFLAIESADLPKFLTMLESISATFADHERTNYDTGGKDVPVDISIPSFGGMVEGMESENLSYEKIIPLSSIKSGITTNSKDDIYDCRLFEFNFKADKEGSYLSGYVQFKDLSNLEALMDIIREEVELSSSKSGMSANTVEHLGKWKNRHELLRFRTEKGSRYYIQTSNDCIYINEGEFDEFLWFNGSELGKVTSLFKTLLDYFNKYKNNPTDEWIEVPLQDTPVFSGILVGRIGNSVSVSAKNSHGFNGRMKAWYQPVESSDPCMRLEIYYDVEHPDGTKSQNKKILCIYESELNGLVTALTKLNEAERNSGKGVSKKTTGKTGFEPKKEVDIAHLADYPFGCINSPGASVWSLDEDKVNGILREAVSKSFLKEAYNEKFARAELEVDDFIDPTDTPSDASFYINNLPVQSIGYRFTDQGRLEYLCYGFPMFHRKKAKWNQSSSYSSEEIGAIVYPFIETMKSLDGWTAVSLKEAHDKYKTTYITDEDGACFVNVGTNTAMVITWTDFGAEIYLTSINK